GKGYKPILAPKAIKTNIKIVPCPVMVAQRAVVTSHRILPSSGRSARASNQGTNMMSFRSVYP
ncbi:hypothetical protein A2U01_0087789, partial [Trifolium medium]|nr:hypothetical protein [Trifolium medium]